VELVTVHSLTWLAASSAVGLLLATLLLVPRLNDLLAPLTYGRWVPLHLDLALYGWLGLPLVGLLLRAYAPAAGEGRLPALAVHAWSGSLAAGAVAWLAGGSSGRPFLDWSGAVRWAFLAALALLWAVLAVLLARRVRAAGRAGRPPWAHGDLGRALLLLALAAVPPLLALAGRPSAYPAVNPDTGGPTGASLLGSSLAVVAMFLVTPPLLGLRRKGRSDGWKLAALLAAHAVALGLVGGGDHSHREPVQVLALASLLPWAWLVPRELARYRWPEGGRRWLAALLAWGGLLLAASLVGFLPGVLDRQKFTHLLVAHAHLAMAAFATSFAALVLVALAPASAAPPPLAAPVPFALWHGGAAFHLAALAGLGWLEIADPGSMFRPSMAADALLAVRWLAGAVMLAAALGWLGRALRRASP
jgi:cytochrome c oxidase cbb3-type subunit 1